MPVCFFLYVYLYLGVCVYVSVVAPIRSRTGDDIRSSSVDYKILRGPCQFGAAALDAVADQSSPLTLS